MHPRHSTITALLEELAQKVRVRQFMLEECPQFACKLSEIGKKLYTVSPTILHVPLVQLERECLLVRVEIVLDAVGVAHR